MEKECPKEKKRSQGKLNTGEEHQKVSKGKTQDGGRWWGGGVADSSRKKWREKPGGKRALVGQGRKQIAANRSGGGGKSRS